MKTDIILSGVGGQGILSLSAILGAAALNEGLYLKQSETHGMSQRGGAVVSHLRISDTPVFSDLIPRGNADLILSIEPMESLRYLPYLSLKGSLVTNTTEYKNIPDYPDLNESFEEIRRKINVIQIDAHTMAREIGNFKASNMVMLGAASPFMSLHEDVILKGIEAIFQRKGEKIVRINLDAFKAGRQFTQERM